MSSASTIHNMDLISINYELKTNSVDYLLSVQGKVGYYSAKTFDTKV